LPAKTLGVFGGVHGGGGGGGGAGAGGALGILRAVEGHGSVGGVNKSVGERDLLGDDRLVLADANGALKRRERQLHSFGLDRKREDFAGPAHAVGAHAFTTGEENHLRTDHLAGFGGRTFQQIEHGELAERLEHDGCRHHGVVLEMSRSALRESLTLARTSTSASAG
jgi:hypothetical protein